MSEMRTITAALAGDPNTGKSTFFNAWTGMHQVTGNWPGVTVEKLLGEIALPGGEKLILVDLPGMYSLHAVSQDERVASDYARGGEADLIINVVDAVNLERNLYLTLALMELGKPMVVVLTMTDVLRRQGFEVDLPELSRRLGVPVVTGDVKRRAARVALERAVLEALATRQRTPRMDLPESLAYAVRRVARENEPEVLAIHRLEGILPGAEAVIADVEKALGTTPDVLIADARYAKIAELTKGVVRQIGHARTELGRALDRIALNRWLGIPLFLLMMYLLFWFTQVVGGCFIDFFDGLGDAFFVTGLGNLLTLCGAPAWLVTLLADGLGVGVQTVLTFIPPVFFIFLGLSILEDSGYMARAALVMDRFMRLLGLPGSAFVPMLVGFGCTVPAIMATRTLSNRRDRLLTIFMTPFMSCGARLPVYALFGAAFFGAASGTMVFAIYLSGIVLAVLTGLLLKHTLFVGEPSPFVMELPLYHIPRVSTVLKQAWERLRHFLFRAGKVMALMVLVLAVCDKIVVPNPFAAKTAEEPAPKASVIEVSGRALAPVFAPMGVEADNWQGSVALIVGLFAKEQVVSSLNTLYSIGDAEEAAEEEEEEPLTWGGAKDALAQGLADACATIPDAFSGLAATFRDPIGYEDSFAEFEESPEDAQEATLARTLAQKFDNDKHRAFAYLLFVLLYVPCLAAMATVVREIGWAYSSILFGYLTLLGWCVATLYYQVTVGHSLPWVIAPCALLAGVAAFFAAYGRKHKIPVVQ
ncbi:MAG TPA: ferrous iron transport protein B [Candidatus Spyradenecus faecavium]|uniref:Ferrous iron transport protein B n=1 Tax=Candidatus Spyradenecus faecavium TaxID=2840947 RepID=A0A9D1NLN0_9BACT|nr:ferrous iron transport protein B [Candidatus Spyradenecus faecavium]